MIFKKTLFALTLIAIYAIAKASASGIDTQKQLAKKQGSRKTSALTLSDTTSTVEAVPVEGESIVMTASSEEQSTPLVNKQLEELIEQEKYDEIEKLGESMSDEEFLKQLCPLIASLAHYKGLHGCLERREMVPGFFVHGRMEILREVIAGIDYDTEHYVKDCDLGTAIPLALKEDRHDRVMDLLVIRQEWTAEKDRQRKQKEEPTSFELFMCLFFENLAPWKDSKSLKRFMTLKKEEFNNKHPAVYENFGRKLVQCLRLELDDPNGKKLMVDLVAQPALLTPVIFAKGFLLYAGSTARSDLITYGWREAVQEGLERGYTHRRKWLWNAITDKYQGEFPPDYPPTAEVLDAVLEKFPTKQDREEAWIKENAPIFVKNLGDIIPLPTVLWNIVFGYSSVTWIQV